MLKRNLWITMAVLSLFLISLPGFGQAFLERTGRWTLGGALGITEDPTLFGTELWVNYYVTDEISVGPLFQYEFQGDDAIFGLSGMVKYNAILANNKIVRPYGQIGIGFADFRHDDLFDGERKTLYLFPAGGGFEFKLADQLSLDTNFMFNISQETFFGIFCGVNYIF